MNSAHPSSANRPLGFRQLNDPRDSKFPLSQLLGGVTARTMTERFYRLGPIMDQGSTSSCVGHGCKLLLTSEPYAQKDAISPFTIYREARVIDEFPDDQTEGTSVRAGLQVLKKRGLIASYHWAQDIEQAVDYLLHISPLVVGTDWYAGMDAVDGDGLVRITGANEGGHCYLACGVDTKAGTILFANSWGVQFGLGGLFQIKIADFATLLHRGGCAAAVREK